VDLTDYFTPVGLERPDFEYLDNSKSFSHHISVHTPDRPVRDLDQHQVALLGVPEDRNAFIKGSSHAPDAVRSHLYQLVMPARGLAVYDLGNLKMGEQVNDTYFALRDVVTELWERGITALVLGGSQDLGRGVFMALEKQEGMHHVLSVDSMLDFSESGAPLHSRNYLDQLLKSGPEGRFSYTNLGHQACFVSRDQLDLLERYHLESIRLGQARNNIRETEPVIRDSRFISIDLGAVKHADAPGASIPSPNGFSGDELCQISRYAGLSERVNALGFFEICPQQDLNGQTAHLASQAIWYFLDGFAARTPEHPSSHSAQIKKFIVNLNAAGHDITFLKSTLTDRWWMEIPVQNPATGHNFFVSCSYDDYQQACNQEIPDRWWRYLNRLGNVSE